MVFSLLLETVVKPKGKFGWLKRWSIALVAFLKPLGMLGLGLMALIDSAAIPIPPDGLVTFYVSQNHAKAVFYCLAAAFGSAIGSIVPYLVGRAGGEPFLLRRINRARYEKIRDRFEKQEFLLIAVLAIVPPPFPLKIFEFAAGVFEMRVAVYLGAMMLGKFTRFVLFSFLVIFFGPSVMLMLHSHLGAVMGVCGIVLLGIAVYVVRRLFDRRRGVKLPIEDEPDA